MHILPVMMDLNQSRDSPGGFMYTGPSRSAETTQKMGEEREKKTGRK